MNTSAEQDNGDYSNEDKMHDKTSASANKGINEKLSVQTKLPFKHSKPLVLCAFVEKLHIKKNIWRIVPNTSV